MTGKIATVDVWHLLRLYPYDRSMHEQHRLNEVMRVPVWRRDPLAPVFVQKFQLFASVLSHSAVWWTRFRDVN